MPWDGPLLPHLEDLRVGKNRIASFRFCYYYDFTMKKVYSPEELQPAKLTVTLRSHIIRDLKEMEANTKQPIDDLITKALLMFIATHSDYLGKTKV
jgi:hypothetical protein